MPALHSLLTACTGLRLPLAQLHLDAAHAGDPALLALGAGRDAGAARGAAGVREPVCVVPAEHRQPARHRARLRRGPGGRQRLRVRLLPRALRGSNGASNTNPRAQIGTDPPSPAPKTASGALLDETDEEREERQGQEQEFRIGSVGVSCTSRRAVRQLTPSAARRHARHPRGCAHLDAHRGVALCSTGGQRADTLPRGQVIGVI